MSALSAMQDKNAHLENSLSAETRIKLDLFSALGEVKRQLEIRESKYRFSLVYKYFAVENKVVVSLSTLITFSVFIHLVNPRWRDLITLE